MYNEYYLPPTRHQNGTISYMESRKDSKNFARSILEANMNREDTVNKYNKFITDTKVFFLKEAMSNLLTSSLPNNISESYINIGKALTENFIIEEGVDKLLNRFDSTSIFLAEMSSIVRECSKDAVDSCDEFDPDTFLIKQSEINKFYDKLDNMNIDTMSGAIADKVAKAEQEFVATNVADRQKMEELAQDTQTKISSYINKDANVTEAVRESYQNQYRANVSKLKERPKGLLEAMVLRSSKNIVKHDELRTQYVNESGKLDTNKIINTCEVMYTFLEMVNTAKIRTVDESYVIELLNSIG